MTATATLEDVAKKKELPPESPELTAARELVRQAKEQGLSLTGPDGLLKQLTKTMLETAFNEELTEHLGHDKNTPRRRRATTMGHALEAGTERVLNHLRRPVPGRRDLLTGC